MNKVRGILIVLALFFVISMCGTVWAEDTSNFDSVTSDAAAFEAVDSTISDSDVVSDVSISDSSVAFETRDSTISPSSDFVTAPCPSNSDIGEADSGVSSEEPQAEQSVTTQQPQSEAEITSTSSDNLEENIISDATLSGETVPKLPDPFNTRTGKGFLTIQEAVDDPDTTDGDEIIVEAGTYNENVIIHKRLTLTAQGAVTVQAADPALPALTINSDGTGSTIQGFTITGATSSCGIYLDSTDNCNIENNTITGNNRGLVLESSFNSSIINSSITGNGVGLVLESSDNNSIIGNFIEDNVEMGECSGIDLYDSNNNQIIDNIITGNQPYGLYLGGPHYNFIQNNIIGGSEVGICLWEANFNHILNNTIKNNAQGLQICKSSNNTLSSNIIEDNGIGLSISSRDNLIFDNIFNNTCNLELDDSRQIWNTAKQLQRNIIGGAYLGGNYWLTPGGDGWSQTHDDKDHDGITDEPYSINEYNIDYLPLCMMGITDTEPPHIEALVTHTPLINSIPIGTNLQRIADMLIYDYPSITIQALTDPDTKNIAAYLLDREYSLEKKEDGRWIYQGPDWLDEGEYTVLLKAVDWNGNQAEKNVTFHVENIKPTLKITPDFGKITSQTALEVEMEPVNISWDGYLSIHASPLKDFSYINFVELFHLTPDSNTLTWRFPGEAFYQVRVRVFFGCGWIKPNELTPITIYKDLTFQVDDTAPYIYMKPERTLLRSGDVLKVDIRTSPLDYNPLTNPLGDDVSGYADSTYMDDSVQVIVRFLDVDYVLDRTGYWHTFNHAITGTTWVFNHTIPLLPDGTYTVFIMAMDGVGNQRVEKFNITVDNTPPIIKATINPSILEFINFNEERRIKITAESSPDTKAVYAVFDDAGLSS